MLRTAKMSGKCLSWVTNLQGMLCPGWQICLVCCPGSQTYIWELFVQGGKFVRAVLSRVVICV